MASFLDFLTQGSQTPQSSTTSTTTPNVPAYYAQYQQALLANAGAVASDPYAPYSGQTIADPSQLQTRAFGYAGNNATNWQPGQSSAETNIATPAAGFDPNKFTSNFISPYQNDVASNISRLGMQNLNENLLPDLNNQFISGGQFGSDRNMQMDERLIRDTGANIAGQQATMMNSNWNSGLTAYNNANANQANASVDQSNLAKQNLDLTGTTSGLLESAGATQRGIDQQSLTQGYTDFLNQRNYPTQQLNTVIGALSGTSIPTGSTTTATQPYTGYLGASPLAQFGSGLATIAGVNNMGGNGAGGGYPAATAAQANPQTNTVPMQAEGGLTLYHLDDYRGRKKVAPRRGGLDMMRMAA